MVLIGGDLTQVLVDINRSYMYWWCLVTQGSHDL